MARDLTAILLLTLIAACSGGGDASLSTGEPAAAETATVATAPDVRLPLLPPSDVGPQVAAPGVLEVEAPCLYLRTPNGTHVLPVFATTQTRWNRTAGVLEVGEQTFKPGDRVVLGGGPTNSLPNVPWVQAPDPRCSAPSVFIVYSMHAE